MNKVNKKGILLAMLAAALYAVNSPFSKLLLEKVPPTVMAGLLYIGAGVGMGVVAIVKKARGSATKLKLTRDELPYTLGMILLDIAAPICLMLGLKSTSAASSSLLNNFEIVATALIALAVFKESISPRLWAGILFVTVSCGVLTFDGAEGLSFSGGSVFILLACVCWGFENNCTRKLSAKDPLQIVLLKGIFSGGGSLVIGLATGETLPQAVYVLAALAVGFVAYGSSIYFYVLAQRTLGAARTSAYYAIAPFIGAGLSLVIFRDALGVNYFIALALMMVGAWLCANDEPLFKKKR